MKIVIQSLNVKARKSLKDFVNEKVGKLDVLSNDIIESRVFLKLEKAENKQNKVCEVRLVIPGYDLFASSAGSSFEGAVHKAVGALKPQIEKRKRSKQKEQFAYSKQMLPIPGGF